MLSRLLLGLDTGLSIAPPCYTVELRLAVGAAGNMPENE